MSTERFSKVDKILKIKGAGGGASHVIALAGDKYLNQMLHTTIC
jgi:hypothetical protein